MATHERRVARETPRKTAVRPTAASKPAGAIEERDAVVIRFAGDAGDGMQLVGTQFTMASAAHGNLVCTLPDPPAEIRAPVGALAGVSGFQVHFSSHAIHTPGDRLDALLAMNPAALKANLPDLEPGALLIVNTDTFLPDELHAAGYASNPLQDGLLDSYRLLAAPMDQLNREAVAKVKLIARETGRCKSFFALGLALWLFDRPLDATLRWIRDTYAKNPVMIEATTRSLNAGYQRSAALRTPAVQVRVAKAESEPGRYRQVSGAEALTLGLLAAAHRTGLPLVFAGFPLAPASEILHQLFEMKQPNVKVIQAEDDLAALNLALGASFGGALGVTATTGPGFSLQSEALGLAVMSELPCVVIDVQRAGPSTGIPSKAEQADLLLALHGRHGECPLIVLAMATPSDGFAIALEAARLAIRCMTPVIVLADAYVTGGAETWRVPTLDELPAIDVRHAKPSAGKTFQPYGRDEHLARPWAIPGTPGLEHRTGGMEKEAGTGNVSYNPLNHEEMVQTRARKIDLAVDTIPPLEVNGPPQGDLLVLGWGSTYGAIAAAVERCQRKGMSVAAAHLRHLSPLPKNTGDVLKRYRKVLVPELNAGQLSKVLRDAFLVDVVSLSKVQGRPFLVREIEQKIEELLRNA
ncbi:MAG: 2-oxoacid:acceptor oxidoreductase subunit alpha [Planctomycetes bacterium]|nr:2-oxoacid:acceptor oxidoreductase subunit alpha [Planctomycetota bacterium]